MKKLSTTIFRVHMPDVDIMRGVLHRQKKMPPAYDDNVEFYLNSVHVRKIIPTSDELLARFQLFWSWVQFHSAPALSNPLPLEALKRVHDQQLLNIQAGYVSGAPSTKCLELLNSPAHVYDFVTPHTNYYSLAFYLFTRSFPGRRDVHPHQRRRN